MPYHYSKQDKEGQAKAAGVSLPVSAKHGREVCRAIKGKTVSKAKTFLENVMELKEAVPYTRYHWDLAHKTCGGPGRYPVETCRHILTIVKSAESNAVQKGLSAKQLVIAHAGAQTGPSVWRYGRQRRRQAKRAHIEVIVEEAKA